jgi:hypothetical protein
MRLVRSMSHPNTALLQRTMDDATGRSSAVDAATQCDLRMRNIQRETRQCFHNIMTWTTQHQCESLSFQGYTSSFRAPIELHLDSSSLLYFGALDSMFQSQQEKRRIAHMCMKAFDTAMISARWLRWRSAHRICWKALRIS